MNGSMMAAGMPARGEIEGSAGEQLLGSGYTIQQVRGSYATAVAVQKPRSLMEVKRRVMQEAILAGEEFYYGWGAGKDSIEGPSVKLALALARCWGNCAVEALPVQTLGDSWIFTAAFVDLETGFTLTRQFRQSMRWIIHGKLDNERKDDIRFQIGQSKAVRNVLLNALPSSLVTAAMEEAKKGVRQRIEDFISKNSLAAAQDHIIRALLKLGPKEPAILARCNVADRKGLTVDHLVCLRGDLQAIESGQERAEVLFPSAEAPPVPEPPAPPAEAPAAEPAPEAPAKARTPKKLHGSINLKLQSLGWAQEAVNEWLEKWDAATVEALTAEQAKEAEADLSRELAERRE